MPKLTTKLCLLCQAPYEGRTNQFYCCAAHARAGWKLRPKTCDCGRVGIKRVGAGYACQRCLDIEAKMKLWEVEKTAKREAIRQAEVKEQMIGWNAYA